MLIMRATFATLDRGWPEHETFPACFARFPKVFIYTLEQIVGTVEFALCPTVDTTRRFVVLTEGEVERKSELELRTTATRLPRDELWRFASNSVLIHH